MTLKSYVTPELRAVIRDQLKDVVYTATSEHNVETARIMTLLARALVADISDDDIDRVILAIWNNDPAVWG